MRKLIPLLAAAAAIPLTATPVAAEGVSYTAANPVIELNVYEEVQSAPDMAKISTGIQTNAPTAKAALDANKAQMKPLVDALKRFGIADKDIQTSGIRVGPTYKYRNDQPPLLTGYEANNNLSVKVRDLDKLGDVIDGLVKAGATNLNGPSFSIADPTPLQAKARQNALVRAMNQAKAYATFAGYSGVKVVWVQETIRAGGNNPPPPVMMRAVSNDAVEESTYVAPGEVGTGVQLALKFEMTR